MVFKQYMNRVDYSGLQWIQLAVDRTSYDVTYVINLFPLCTVTSVTNRCVKLVFGNIYQMVSKTTQLCHLKSEDLLQNAQNIQEKYVTLHCKQCKSPICALCISSGEHEQHKKFDLLKRVESKQADLRSNLLELEECILPKYVTIASNISMQKNCLQQNFQKVENEIDKRRKEWHREIDTVIKKAEI